MNPSQCITDCFLYDNMLYEESVPFLPFKLLDGLVETFAKQQKMNLRKAPAI